MAKAADLSRFQVNVEKPSTEEEPAHIGEKAVKLARRLLRRGFALKPEAARQFDMLKAEVEGVNGKDKGPALIAEALNLLFEKYGRPPVA